MIAKRKAVVAILAIVLLSIGARTLVVVTDPLRRSDADIREWLLKKTPIGSSFEEVRAVAIRDDWKITYEDPFNPRQPVVGERVVRFEIGHYRSFVIPYHVFATYRLVGDRLVEIGKIDTIGDFL